MWEGVGGGGPHAKFWNLTTTPSGILVKIRVTQTIIDVACGGGCVVVHWYGDLVGRWCCVGVLGGGMSHECIMSSPWVIIIFFGF